MPSEPPQVPGHKCRVCSMPYAAELAACPSCAYDRRAAAEAGAVVGDRAGNNPPRGLKWWKARR